MHWSFCLKYNLTIAYSFKCKFEVRLHWHWIFHVMFKLTKLQQLLSAVRRHCTHVRTQKIILFPDWMREYRVTKQNTFLQHWLTYEEQAEPCSHWLQKKRNTLRLLFHKTSVYGEFSHGSNFVNLNSGQFRHAIVFTASNQLKAKRHDDREQKATIKHCKFFQFLLSLWTQDNKLLFWGPNLSFSHVLDSHAACNYNSLCRCYKQHADLKHEKK